jgi:hypothetical protein
MAKQRGNVVTHGLNGKVGGLLVFRQKDGETIVSKIPEPSKKVSEGQKKQREIKLIARSKDTRKIVKN